MLLRTDWTSLFLKTHKRDKKDGVLRQKFSAVVHRWLGYDRGKADLEFVTGFAQEVAQGLLAQVRPEAAENLSKLVARGHMFEFKEKELELLLCQWEFWVITGRWRVLIGCCIRSYRAICSSKALTYRGFRPFNTDRAYQETLPVNLRWASLHSNQVLFFGVR